MAVVRNTVVLGDNVERMDEWPAGIADLVFADPPFNIGYDYDVYDDSRASHDYLSWSRWWIAAVHRLLKPNGTFWLAIGDEYAAELKIESQRLGFTCRSWVVWYYTFGVNCARKFTRSHAHLFHFVKDAANFVFRDDDLDNRVPSARELVYNDRRANARGRLPDDTWIIRPAAASGELVGDEDATWRPPPPRDAQRTFTLRPQDLDGSFQPSEDTWYFPRVAGTHKERAGFHGCQMPEQLLGRIIRTCSHPGDLVVDPFSGSATTLAVAKKLGRDYLGIDISADYVRYGLQRLEAIRVGDRLDGSPEPLKSAPSTKSSPSNRKRSPATARAAASSPLPTPETAEIWYDARQIESTERGVIAAFQAGHAGYSADRIVADPELNAVFLANCRARSLVGDARTWNTLLFRLRKNGRLAEIVTDNRTTFSWEDIDRYLFASEIAWQSLLNDGAGESLDEILCDPELAQRFDALAAAIAPGHSSLEYRWAALKIRKEAFVARSRAAVLTPPSRWDGAERLCDVRVDEVPSEAGLYVLRNDADEPLYVGEALDLRQRVRSAQGRLAAWTRFGDALRLSYLKRDVAAAGHLAWQSCLVKRLQPRLNCFELHEGR